MPPAAANEVMLEASIVRAAVARFGTRYATQRANLPGARENRARGSWRCIRKKSRDAHAFEVHAAADLVSKRSVLEVSIMRREDAAGPAGRR